MRGLRLLKPDDKEGAGDGYLFSRESGCVRKRRLGIFQGGKNQDFHSFVESGYAECRIAKQRGNSLMDLAHVVLAFLLAVHSIGGVLMAIRLKRLSEEISSTMAIISALVRSERAYHGRDGILMRNDNLE